MAANNGTGWVVGCLLWVGVSGCSKGSNGEDDLAAPAYADLAVHEDLSTSVDAALDAGCVPPLAPGTRYGVLQQGAFATPPNPTSHPFPTTGVNELSNVGRAQLLTELGVKYARMAFTYDDITSNAAATAYLAANLALVANLLNRSKSSTNTYTTGISNPADLATYGMRVDALLAAQPVDLLVIENEENNPDFFVGTPQQYAAQLQVAVTHAHAACVRITNGGLTNLDVAVATWHSILKTQGSAAANLFVQAAFTPVSFSGPSGARSTLYTTALMSETDPNLSHLMSSDMDSEVYDRIVNAEQFIAIYRASEMDFVNVHIYERDLPTFETMVSFMASATGKQVITNEMGDYDGSPATVTAMLQAALDEKMPYALWFSGDGDPALSLANIVMSDASVATTYSLRDTGTAFQTFMTMHPSP